MKRRLMAVGAAVTVALGIAYVARPVGHIPPYDANLVRLAETELEGYCAGDTFWKTGGTGDSALAAECRRTKKRPDEPNMRAVQKTFCEAIVNGGWEGTAGQCLEIMDVNRYWPTYDGAISDQWNRARPYPGTFGTSVEGSRGSGSRTGDRTGGERTDTPSRSYGYP